MDTALRLHMASHQKLMGPPAGGHHQRSVRTLGSQSFLGGSSLRACERRNPNNLNGTKQLGRLLPEHAPFTRRFLQDTLEQVRSAFSEYEITPYHIQRADHPTVFVNYCEVAGQSPLKFSRGSLWWAYSFGRLENAPPARIPDISIWTCICRIEVNVDAEIQSAQQVVKQRISSDGKRFNQLIQELGEGLTLKLCLKCEHQPRFYHRVT